MKTINKNPILILRLLKTTVLVLMILNFISCSDDEDCDYDVSCIPNQSNSQMAGFTVATYYNSASGGSVGVIYDTSFNSQAPIGDDWGTTISAPQVTTIRPTNWKENEIGQVFGIAIDNAENIYLASSDIYNDNDSFGMQPPSTSSNFAYIYKCPQPTFNANSIPFITLPSTSDPLNDIGNIAYDKVNNQLFATNLEDGKIYRITGLNSSSGTIIETYDPWAIDGGGNGIVTQEERIWAIGVNYEGGNVKVYFPRVSSTERSIYSITLQTDGSFPALASEIIEIANVLGSQRIISDIAFSSNFQEMLIAERGHPHQSKTLSYSRGGSWSFNKKYYTGGNNSYSDFENTAGGVDFAYKEDNNDISAECDVFFWTTANFMMGRNSAINPMYGIEGISYSGNNPTTDPIGTANQDTDLFIDFDGIGGTNFKGTFGDVEVFDASRCFDLCNY